MQPGAEIIIGIDQTLTQDATGTLVHLALEAMRVERVKTGLSVQYVDHNLLQEDYRNADDHLFLQSACQRFGLWFSPPGNGVSHPVHMQRFGRPSRTLLGSDSHTCAGGSLGMLAMGAGGLDVAVAMATGRYSFTMPKIWGVNLIGSLPDWVSAKDVILEMLRRHGTAGARGRIIEYHGPGLAALAAMDRHVIANMGIELGATATVFPSDEETRRFLESEGREEDWSELVADADASYDLEEEIDLSTLGPLIAKPSNPGNVVAVSETAGEPIYQAYIGSSANPGFRDFAVCARMVSGRRIHAGVSLDVNPTSRQLLQLLIRDGSLAALIAAGARLHQAGCNGCIGMGQAPATGRNSLRTVPRNFPGRSGTREDSVFLCSPETATASALRGVITDPRDLDVPYPRVALPPKMIVDAELLEAPLPLEQARSVELVKGPNIASIPRFAPAPDALKLPILLKVGDDFSTDEILPAGAKVLPFRSNIPRISEFAFSAIDPDYSKRARQVADGDGHAVIGGANYGQGSSREHAALAPRYLGLRAVLAKSFSRIHRNNLVNFGVLPLRFGDPGDYDCCEAGMEIRLSGLHEALRNSDMLTARVGENGRPILLYHDLLPRERQVLCAGGLINQIGRL